jgi:hypothetical protein
LDKLIFGIIFTEEDKEETEVESKVDNSLCISKSSFITKPPD